MALTALSLVGCEQLVDADSFAVDRGPAWAEPACRQCVASSCDLAACEADAACAQYANCLRTCAAVDHACRTSCFFAHWDGTEPQRRFDACYRGSCSAGCVSVGSYYPARGGACQTCLLDQCSEQLGACVLDPACDASFSCGTECSDPNCQMTCTDRAFGGYEACLGTPAIAGETGVCRNSCRDACAFGRDWDCVGAYDWKASSDEVRRAFRIVRFSGASKPYPGVEVQVCASADPLCELPIDAAVSDDSGLACLTVPSVGIGFQGFLGTHDPSDAQRALYYLRHPVTHAVGGDEVILPNATEIAAVSALLGVEQDGARAQIAAIAYDCVDAPAPGIGFEIDIDDQQMVPFYTRNNVPDPTAAITDDTGLGGWANVPLTGLAVTISARLKSSDEVVARREIVLRAGAVTIVGLTPRTD